MPPGSWRFPGWGRLILAWTAGRRRIISGGPDLPEIAAPALRVPPIGPDHAQDLLDRGQPVADLGERVVHEEARAVGPRGAADLRRVRVAGDEIAQPIREPQDLENADAAGIAGVGAGLAPAAVA